MRAAKPPDAPRWPAPRLTAAPRACGAVGHTVHGVAVSNDGHVYVCDRDRGLLFVHLTDGTFVQQIEIGELFVLSMGPDAPRGIMAQLGFSGPWGLAFSPDADQTYLFLSSPDQMILILDRASMNLLTTVGETGVAPGFFNSMHSPSSNSDGDIFVTEIGHGRIQKFTNKGLASAPRYAHLPTFNATPPPNVGPRYASGLAFGVWVLHTGCPGSDIIKGVGNTILGWFLDADKECTPDSWTW